MIIKLRFLIVRTIVTGLFLAGLEPATFRVLGGRDNHYTTETCMYALGIYGMSEMPRSYYTNCRIEECVVGAGSVVSVNLISDEVE